jgi:hypothetical protein
MKHVHILSFWPDATAVASGFLFWGMVMVAGAVAFFAFMAPASAAGTRGCRGHLSRPKAVEVSPDAW